MNYFEFITNPESFSQTVENMFYVSFLIRNSVAGIDDTSGQPILSTRTYPTMDELAGGLNKKQIIMSLSIPLWKVKKEGIRNGGGEMPKVILTCFVLIGNHRHLWYYRNCYPHT